MVDCTKIRLKSVAVFHLTEIVPCQTLFLFYIYIYICQILSSVIFRLEGKVVGLISQYCLGVIFFHFPISYKVLLISIMVLFCFSHPINMYFYHKIKEDKLKEVIVSLQLWSSEITLLTFWQIFPLDFFSLHAITYIYIYFFFTENLFVFPR